MFRKKWKGHHLVSHQRDRYTRHEIDPAKESAEQQEYMEEAQK